MKPLLSASLMCADPLYLARDLAALEEAKIDYLHCDVMDGHFVPNLMLSTEFVRAVRGHCQTPLDIHLMVERPENILDWFAMGANDYVSIHYESTPHVQRALAAIRARGARPVLALNPATPVECAREMLPSIDMLLLMTVNPGYAAQTLIPGMLDKIARARRMLDAAGYADMPIEVDGNCSYENLPRMRERGASVFVVGSSSAFDKQAGIPQGVRRTREALG